MLDQEFILRHHHRIGEILEFAEALTSETLLVLMLSLPEDDLREERRERIRNVLRNRSWREIRRARG